ncbi:MAG: hypothetical protein Q7S19_02085 [bacterium]|nr:hypothetical protein [bacterium]
MMKKILIFIFIILPATSFAYTEVTDGGQLSAEVSPQNPGAFTNVYIHLVSFEVDLDRSNIIWTVNGRKQQEGIGQDDLQFVTGAIGKKTVVSAEVISQDGKNIKKQISIIPAEADLIWQSDGYVPPFYRGKSLATVGNNIKLVAIPDFITENGVRLDPDKLVYKWSVNGEDITSGYGQSSATIGINDQISEVDIFVDISNLDKTLRATKSIAISPTNPILLFYETNPLLGTLYNTSLFGNLQMTEAESTIKVEPYFYNTNKVSYAWGINNEDPDFSAGTLPELIVRQPRDSSGEATITASVATVYQSIKKSITIKFNQSTIGF